MRKLFSTLSLTLFMATAAAADSIPDAGRIVIAAGSGSFEMPGGVGHADDVIRVHYYKPNTFTRRSPILLVIAGAGRNGDSYRDSWIATAEKHGVLVLSPSYTEEDYDIGNYQFAGVIRDIQLRNVRIDPGTQIYRLNDEDISFRVEPDARTYLFADFDRLFGLARSATRSRARSYDIFGHSAGGQILHRFAIFAPHSKAARIVAANAGLYTLPRFDENLPFGLRDAPLAPKNVAAAFRKRLTILLGELDNEDEKRGIHLRTPTADKQGIGRRARGQHFFTRSREAAAARGEQFAWRLEVVPGVGHDQRAMAEAAARLLYGQ
jgi:pimeloyl-ACP methyl ester carboxylesterase